MQKVATKIRLGLFHDQTSEACDWHLPLAHYLEGWGDTETSDGTLCCVQPLIAPLNGAQVRWRFRHRSARRAAAARALEVLALLTQFPNPADGKPVDLVPRGAEGRICLVRKVFAERSGIALDDKEFDTEFNRYKQLGFFPTREGHEGVACIAPGSNRRREDRGRTRRLPVNARRRRRTRSKSPSTRTTRCSTAGSR